MNAVQSERSEDDLDARALCHRLVIDAGLSRLSGLITVVGPSTPARIASGSRGPLTFCPTATSDNVEDPSDKCTSPPACEQQKDEPLVLKAFQASGFPNKGESTPACEQALA